MKKDRGPCLYAPAPGYQCRKRAYKAGLCKPHYRLANPITIRACPWCNDTGVVVVPTPDMLGLEVPCRHCSTYDRLHREIKEDII